MEDQAQGDARADGGMVGDYKIVRTLGQGAFAITYEAIDQRLGHKVVIKELFIRGQSARDGESIQHPDRVGDTPITQIEAQFRNEGRVLAAVSHPALVNFIESFTLGGATFLVTELVEGPSLQSYLDRRTTAPDERALRAMFAPVLDALEAMHTTGLLHGDIKPSNIVIGPAGSVLIDPGAGRGLVGAALENAGLSFADLSYGAPEQLDSQSRNLGATTDIYALAATIYAVVSGAPPIPARERLTHDKGGWRDLHASLRSFVIDPALDDVCDAVDQALKLNPRERLQSVADFRKALGWTSNSSHPIAPAAPEPPPVPGPEPLARDAAVLVRPLSDAVMRGASGRGLALAQTMDRPLRDPVSRPPKADAVAAGTILLNEPAPPAPPARAAPEVYPAEVPEPASGGPAPQASPGRAGHASRSSQLNWILVAGVGVAALAIAAQLFGKEVATGLLGVAKALKLSTLGIAPAAAMSDTVDVSVFAPPKAEPGDQFLVQVFLHAFDDDDEAQAAAVAADASTQKRGAATLDIDLPRGERLEIVLDAPELTIETSAQAIVWRGRSRSVQFLLTVPLRHNGGPVQARARILRASMPVAQVRFVVSVQARAPSLPLERTGQSAKRFTRAFLSYAHEDRVEVLKRAQALRAAKIEVFQDLLSLSPGEEWRDRLKSEIDQCDLFLLFWSAAARRSEWVNREVDQAISIHDRSDKAMPEIMPVILEGPPPPAPPERLKHLHFDDGLCYVIAANPADRAKRERREPGSEA